MKKTKTQSGKWQMPRAAFLFCALAGTTALLNPSTVRAVDGTWINDTTSGNWSDTANWVGGIVADGAGYMADTAQLHGGTYHIDLDTDRTIGFVYLRPNDPGISNRVWVLNGPGVLTLSDPSNPLAYNAGPRINVRDGISVCNAVIAGNEGMGMCNLGTLFVTATNTYTGNTLIFRGTLQIGNVDALPHGSRTGNVILMMGGNPTDFAKLDLQNLDITINGLNSATNNVSTAIPQVTTLSSTLGTSTLTLGDNDANGVFDGTIDDGSGGRAMALTKIGAGTQVLNGFCSYSGATTVNDGLLAIDGYIVSPTTVNGGVLGGNGSIYTMVTVNAGGSISGGESVGILHLAYGLDLSAGGTNIWELAANSDSNPGTDFDQLDLQSVAGGFDLTDSTLLIKLTGSVNTSDAFWTSGHNWSVITSGGLTGSSNFKAVKVVGGTPPGTFSTANNGSDVVLTYTYTGIVPQPPPTHVKITKITGAGTGSVTVNYTNTLVGTNYVLQYNTNLNTVNWYPAGNKTAAGTSDSQTDSSASGVQRYYRVYYNYAP